MKGVDDGGMQRRGESAGNESGIAGQRNLFQENRGSSVNRRAHHPSLLFRLIHCARGICIAFAGCVAVAGCAGYGMAYKEPIEYQFSGLGVEMNAALGRVFRPSLWSMRGLAGSPYGDPKRYEYYRHATIPMGHAQIKERDMCDRKKNPYCEGFTFGEELLAHPEVIAAMSDWLTHLCERLPVTVTDPLFYHSVVMRQTDLRRLRAFLDCDGTSRGVRDIQIHVFVVRDFDNVFISDPRRPGHTDAVLRQSVIREWVIKINP